jgi:peptide/nickel transport system ATP-binding protein
MTMTNAAASAPAPVAAGDAAQPLLQVSGLKTHFFTRAGVVKAVDGVDLYLGPGEILGLVGESGSGKSITGFSLIGLLDEPGRVVDGSIRFNGDELRNATPARMRALRGNDIAMIFQDPMMTLNPVLRVDTQMIEAIQAHRKMDKAAARKRARDVLAMVGIPSPDERLRTYPHQLSGGMRQRVAIAIALLNEPRVIIADEPTTALDVTIQGQILYEVQKLCRETGTALLWITHDLAVVSGLADRIAVMYAGRVVETGTTADVIGRPLHPYTHGLMMSIPTPETHGHELASIPGMTPSLLKLPEGCAFRTRCPRATEACLRAPENVEWRPGHWVRCWHAGEPEAR